MVARLIVFILLPALITLCSGPAAAFASGVNAGTPFDQDILDQIKLLGRSQAEESNALKQIKDLLVQREQWGKMIGGLPPGRLRHVSLEGELSVAVVDYVDSSGKISANGRAYFLETARGTRRFFPLDHPPGDSAHGKHLRITGIATDDEQVVAKNIEILAAAKGAAKGAASAGVAIPDVPPCGASGPQKGIVIAVNYLDDPVVSPTLSMIDDIYFADADSLRDYWREASYGKTDLTGDSFGWYTLDINSADACKTGILRTKALELVAADTDLTQYNRLFIVMHDPNPGCGWVGSGSLSCSNLSTPDGTMYASTSWVTASWYNNHNSGVWLSAHESGHNIHLHHASVRDYGASSTGPIGGSSAGNQSEYGDRYDSMGNYVSPSHYNADHKYGIQWLTDDNISFVNGDASLVIEAMAASLGSLPKAARLFRGVDSTTFRKEYFWLEMRQPIGYDAFMDSRGWDGILVHHQTSSSGNKTENLDLHPGSDTGDADYFDALLYATESFTDPYSGITITHQGLNANGHALIEISVDPARLDSDEDGISGFSEQVYGTNPGLEDTDADGLTDLMEVCYDGDCTNYHPYPAGGDSNASNNDTEGDGMPDGWEIDNALDPLQADAAGDADQDSLSNLDEYRIGTDPNNPDTDADDLIDGQEVNIYGTDPSSPDTDTDGMPDGWEISFGLNPFVDDSALDQDYDGLSNLEEYEANTSPQDSDTDDDGLSDNDEVNVYGTDPLVVDTDSDGLGDGEEINQYGTDPLSSADTDEDRMPDDWETARGTNVVVNDAQEDADGDGAVNVIEFLRNTLPHNAGSTPVLATIHVDGANITGIEDGTAANPYRRIETAMQQAQDGDTLLIAAGTYELGFFSYIRSVRLLGVDRQETVLSATYFIPNGVSWSRLENLTLKTRNYNYPVAARNVVYENCRVIATSGSLLLSNSLATFRNCELYGGVNNGIDLNTDSDLVMENSTLAGYGSGVVVTSEMDSKVSINNCILANNAMDLFGITDSNSVNDSLVSDGKFAGINGNITGDPMFRDAANGDYHLADDSPAIDAGDPDAEFSNEPEPNGCRLNQGAFGNSAEAAISPDPDNDGLHGYCEARIGTDPRHPDTDYDGVPDGADGDPLNLFSPAGEGLNIASDASFLNATTSFGSNDTLYILAWSNVVGAGANNHTYSIGSGGDVITGELADQGDGSYTASVSLGVLNYTGPDIQVSIHLQRRNIKYDAGRTITIADNTVGTPPTLAVVSPLDGSRYGSGVPINFSATANDVEDGDLSASISWSSSLEGTIGTGGNFNISIGDGTHVITANVTDSDGNSTGSGVMVTVGELPAITLAASTQTKGKNTRVQLSWTGATSDNVDIYLNEALLVTTANNGGYSDNLGKNPVGEYDYYVCEASTDNCSSVASLVF